MGYEVRLMDSFARKKELMKRVHCYISSLEGGGAERQMAYLCNFLAEEGYDVTLVTLLDVPDKYITSERVKRKCLGYHLTDNLLIKLAKKIKVFLYFLSLRTDCVISFLIGPNAQVLYPMRLRPKVKVIVSERNFVTWDLSKFEQRVYGKLYNRANYVVSNSHSMTKYLANYNPQLCSRLVTITNYTDLNIYKEASLQLHDVLQIGVFARFDKQKNYERFAEMLSYLKGLDHRPFFVRWYGDMNANSCYSHFCQLIDKYEIRDYIELHDFVSDVPKEMESLDIICLPSIYEGFSNSLAEALCCGKPVIAGDVSDNSIMIEDGVNGYLFNPQDVTDMSKVFLRTVNTPNSVFRRMADNSRKKAEDLFGKEKFVNQYVSLIEGII